MAFGVSAVGLQRVKDPFDINRAIKPEGHQPPVTFLNYAGQIRLPREQNVY
jgi:hypothetical protein